MEPRLYRIQTPRTRTV